MEAATQMRIASTCKAVMCAHVKMATKVNVEYLHAFHFYFQLICFGLKHAMLQKLIIHSFGNYFGTINILECKFYLYFFYGYILPFFYPSATVQSVQCSTNWIIWHFFLFIYHSNLQLNIKLF